MQFGQLPTDKSGFPSFRYHATKEPVIVNNNEDAMALGQGWSKSYVLQEYPRRLYKENGETLVARNKTEHEKYTKQGYQTTPFENVTPKLERSSADQESEIKRLQEQLATLQQVQAMSSNTK